MFSNIKYKKILKIINFLLILRNHKCVTLLLCKTIKMNGHSVIFGQLVQKLKHISSTTSTIQDDQNKWSQCNIWTVSLIVEIFFGFINLDSDSAEQRLKNLRIFKSF